MLISTKGRYALHIMVELAQNGAQSYMSLPVIAERQEISEKYLESIISVLVKAGLVEGVRGKGGGYRLRRPPEDYSVGEIIRLTAACAKACANHCPSGKSLTASSTTTSTA